MGTAIGAGAKAGKEAGQKKGKKVGAKSDPDNGRVKEDAKSFAKGAASGATSGATRGAVKGAGEGIKNGAKYGSKIGGSIPYAGVVLGPVGGVVGGAVGGGIGTAAGATSGAVTGAAYGGANAVAETEKNRAINKQNNRKGFRKHIGSLKDNIKDLMKGDAKAKRKALLMLKIKGIAAGILIAIITFGVIAEEIAKDTSKVSTSSATAAMSSSSNAKAAEEFETSGSLIYATNDDVNKISDSFLNSIKNTNPSYYEALNKVYSGSSGVTVANKVKHITTNVSSSETEELDVISDSITKLPGEASLSDEKTIYEHIMMAEKYNFNKIIWRSYEKGSGGLTKKSIKFQLDKESKLKYPAKDTNETDVDLHDLDFFVSKTKAYLQSWYIPFDLMIGAEDAQSSGNLNTNFAYQILDKAYHEIVMDRYKMENLVRDTNYRVYDKTTTTTTTTRTCNYYNVKIGTETKRKKGEACTKDDYNKGLCEDYKVVYKETCDRRDINKGVCEGLGKKYDKNCTDSDFSQGKNGCTYGKLKQNISEDQVKTIKYCIDKDTVNTKTEKDIREALVGDEVKDSIKKSDSDTRTYRWNYVLSLAKVFDNVMSNEYKFTALYEYDVKNFNKYIKKTGTYKDMKIDDFTKSEQEKSKADSFTHNEADYYDKKEEKDNTNKDWNKDNVVAEIPSGATKITYLGESQKTVKEVKTIEKKGKTYEDIYVWDDKLDFEGTKSGIYNIDSVKDVTGDDFTYDDNKYYSELYSRQNINLIDIMNSDDNIFKNYLTFLELRDTTSNIGIKKSFLDISYTVLTEDLKQLIKDHPAVGLTYGSSLGIDISSFSILNGLSIENSEGNISTINLEGQNVTLPVKQENIKYAYVQMGRRYRKFIWICRT